MATKLDFAKKRTIAAVTLFTVLVFLSLLAQAQQKIAPNRSLAPLAPVGPDCTMIVDNLFANCGFETGDFTGWTVLDSGDMSVDSTANNGAFAASLGSLTRAGCLEQTLTTNFGQTYTLSFALTNAGRPNSFYVLYNGAFVSGDMQSMPDFAYTQYTIGSLVGTGSDTVDFCAQNQPSYFHLDDAIFN